ncbi:Na+/Ca+ antiporter, CaCA family [Gloeothece citriformis PCC 7424]|uniref:Na+/Ca+ antiporter, CaCA family n=1 Tax=Gloeothece citriformis (strain PCC 7424) TaxID=65393 RepID=B7KDB9_GLOC7|nr:calcium/sodium antiporter [Gloeothece citriformis]ACK68939.1 Na+/Ca+ antiporter, CaCA family [Gloeothece citriformis PCC 7424]
MNIFVLSQLVAGLVLLVVGAEILVRGASKLATLLGIPSLVIGLTIVAYGTSAPEMAVSVQSALAGEGDIAIGNVIGSNIFNVLAILGISSVVVPLFVDKQLIKLDVPIMIGLSVLTFFFSLDRTINRSDGVILFLGAVIYTAFLFYQSRREKPSEEELKQEEQQIIGHISLVQWLTNIGFIIIGLGLLVLGSRWLVNSSIIIAQAIGVSELIIGLTIVSAGTSLPELATSVVASFRGERDIAVGNVVGSNIFNILAVLGLAAAVSPTGITVSSSLLNFDLPVMIAVAVACLPVFFTGRRINRWEGLLFLGYYVAYTIYLLLKSTQHDSLPIFSSIMLSFVIPITAVTLLVLSLQSLHKRNKRKTKEL